MMKYEKTNNNRHKLTSLNEVMDEFWGEIGTPERDRIEAQIKEEVDIYLSGQARTH